MICRRETMPSALCWTSALLIIASWIVLRGFETEAAPIISEKITMYYLSQLGYLPPVRLSSKGNMRKEALSKGISRFQSAMRINVTGNMNAETAGLMKLPRCGVDDKDGPRNSGRRKRYALVGTQWLVKHLTYRISKYTETLTRQAVDNEIARAFTVWSEQTDLKFTPELGEVDIDIRFERKDHGDGTPFDGNSNFLAHAFYPWNRRSIDGDIHFDDDENWTLHSSRGQNLFETAVHEIGHALGLNHSVIGSSVMTPIAKPYNPNYKLDEDDIQGIQKLYGPKTRHDGPDICADPKIDVMLESTEGQIFVFKGNYYWELTTNKIVTGNPKLIAETWKELPGDIDAAYTNAIGKTYFFKGSMYWRYIGVKIDGDYPRRIIEGFPAIPDNLDAATMWTGDKKIYFYKGTKFWIFAPLQNAYRTSPIFKNSEVIPEERSFSARLKAAHVHHLYTSFSREVLDTVLRAETC